VRSYGSRYKVNRRARFRTATNACLYSLRTLESTLSRAMTLSQIQARLTGSTQEQIDKTVLERSYDLFRI